MAKVKKLTIEQLKNIISSERAKVIKESGSMSGFGKMRDAPKKADKEVDADEYADTLEKDIDHARALKIREAKLRKALKDIREMRVRFARKIAKKYKG